MDSQRDGASEEEKKKKQTGAAPEVVLLISGEDSSSPNNVESRGSAPKESGSPKDSKESNPSSNVPVPSSSPEIVKSSPSPKKPRLVPTQPQALFRQRRSFSRSVLSKPKSRFVEENALSSRSPRHGSPATTPRENLRAGGTSKTSSVADEDEEDEEEIYKKEQSQKKNGKRKGKCKVRVLIEWLILVAATACLTVSLIVHRLQGFMIWGLEIWKWCVMVMVICCGRLLTNWLVVLLVFLIERNFLLKKKVLYFVYGLKNSVQVCIWLGLVLLSWSLLFNHGVRRSPGTAKVLNYVSRALVSLLVGSVMWLLKTLLVKLLAASFHVNTFFDRIQESIFHQYVLQTLSGPPVMELAEKVGSSKSTGQLSFRSTGKGKGKGKQEHGVIDVGKLHKLRQDKVSAWTMKGLINAIRNSGILTISNVIDESVNDEGGGEQRDNEITNEWEAKAVAYRIFKNVVKPGCKYIEEEDLLRFLSKEEVDIVLPLFEGASETGKIKKSALKNWVMKAYLDRKSLAHSLNDTKTAVNQLHKLASAIVIVVIIMISLLLMGFATTQVFVLISSQLLLVVFMFGNTCKTAFEAIIFVFIMHPFDVGDRCVIDGVQMIVEEMNILTTVFLRYDNEKIYYPNAVLSTKPISNFYRSPDMSDSVEFSIDFSTSVESIGALKVRIKSYIENKPQHWHPNHTVVVKDIVNVNRMNLALYVLHTMNHQNMPEKNTRRSELVIELKKIFEELSIRYNLLPQEVRLSYIEPISPPLTIGR